ncbi:endonuclease/exonuclease/phosphatase family protein [Streptomyces zhihengii]|uniref:Endonuclease/exonuclease/phosphatase family protein n=1 Tax=Streptomyces zhihengii TaxID=1818004 RepID=A0ABS2V0X6_9ACTN|nr:endonuclease/exonuclease/phosphatase family protein [Streptomyces zhihengii]
MRDAPRAPREGGGRRRAGTPDTPNTPNPPAAPDVRGTGPDATGPAAPGTAGSATTGAADSGATGATGPAGPGVRYPRVRRAVRGLFGPGPWKRGPLLAALALGLGLLLLLHAEVTDRGGLGSLVETFLPWLGLFVPVLLAAALWHRSATALIALLLPVTAWLSLFGGLLAGGSAPGGDLTVVSHNVNAENPDPAGTARDLAASGADLLALQEMTPQATETYRKELAAAYPHHTVRGTVGLWSRLPLSDSRAVDVLRGDAGPLAETRRAGDRPAEPPRALRVTVATDRGPLAVYVAHLGSVRLMPRNGFWTDSRDAGAVALTAAVAAEPNERVMVLGDMNGTTDDRVFDGLTARLDSAHEKAGDGFGFSWPASFPMARIDQILARGVEPRSAWVLPATPSDHLPVAAAFAW